MQGLIESWEHNLEGSVVKICRSLIGIQQKFHYFQLIYSNLPGEYSGVERDAVFSELVRGFQYVPLPVVLIHDCRKIPEISINSRTLIL